MIEQCFMQTFPLKYLGLSFNSLNSPRLTFEYHDNINLILFYIINVFFCRLFKKPPMLSISLSLNMNHLTPKQKTRHEKKKKKMAALVEISRLNDIDSQPKFAVEIQKQESMNCDTSSDQPLCKKKRPNLLDSDEGLAQTTFDFQHLTSECELKVIDTESNKVECSYSELKSEYRNIKQRSKSAIRFRLKATGEKASLITQYDKRVPLFMTDIQQLILFSIMGRHTYLPSRWCQLEKYSDVSHTVVLAIEGISLYHFTSYESVLKGLSVLFENKIEVITPNHNNLIEDLAALPHINLHKDKFGSLEETFQNVIDNMTMIKAIFPIRISNMNTVHNSIPATDKYSRKLLLMSIWQMVEDNYPLPLKGELCRKYKNYVLTKELYSEISSSSPMFGLDCEMCRTQNELSELTRITIVNEKHEIIYDKLVKPYSRITDYLTKYSGITEAMLRNVTTRLEDVQRDLRRILPDDAILIGHSLNCDLKALKMMHPYCIDTSVIFNITGDRSRKSKLRTITKKFLGEVIQQDSSGHNSAEDSLASLKLAQLKLDKSLDFGDSVLYGLRRSETNYARSNSKSGNNKDHILKDTIVVSSRDTAFDYNQYLNKFKVQNARFEICNTNKDIVKELCNNCTKYKFSLAHLHIPTDDLQYPAAEKTLGELDQWIIDVWTNMAANGLCVIIFNGQSQGSGLCFLGIKK